MNTAESGGWPAPVSPGEGPGEVEGPNCAFLQQAATHKQDTLCSGVMVAVGVDMGGMCI